MDCKYKTLEIKYHYHDSVIKNIFIKGEMLIIYIHLYSVFYENEPEIELCFDKITNIDKCRYWVNKLLKEFDNGENYLGARIDEILVYKENENLYKCFIKIDGMEKIKFKCRTVLENEN